MSQTVTMTLTEFLLARIAEDEAVAWAAVDTSYGTDAAGRWVIISVPYEGSWPESPANDNSVSMAGEDGWQIHATRHDPARVLAECQAKRHIVAMIEQCDPGSGDMDCYVLHKTGKFLAAVYADHPDYQEVWKP